MLPDSQERPRLGALGHLQAKISHGLPRKNHSLRKGHTETEEKCPLENLRIGDEGIECIHLSVHPFAVDQEAEMALPC